MRFYTPEECAQWCGEMGVALDGRRKPIPELTSHYRLRCQFPADAAQLLWFSRSIESGLRPRQACMLWVTEWGVAQSRQNQHLYYRLRQSYGDYRLINEAPGHYCLDYEDSEVVTLIYLSILFGWDVHLIPVAGHGRVFVYHHEWIEMGFDVKSQFEEACRVFKQAELEVSIPDSSVTE